MFADIPNEGDALGEEKVESPSESQAEKDEKESPSHEGDKKKESDKEKEEDEKEKDEDSEKDKSHDEDEDKLPFHKHPRFKEVIEERNELKKQVEELNQKVDEKFASIKNSGKKEIPSWFSRLYGDDEIAYEEYNKADQIRKEEIKKEIREEFEKAQKKEEEDTKKWVDWVKQSVQELKDEGKKFDKNALLKIMTDYKPTDDNGNLDFHRGYEILQAIGKKDSDKITEKKKIADNAGSGGNSAEPKASDIRPWNEVRREGW